MKSNQSIWAVRVLALAAFATTVWFCGPSAAAVLAARFGSEAQPGPMVILDRVGFTARPDWLDGEMLVSVAESVSPWLSDEVGLLDEETSRRMRDGLMTTPWVHDVRIERVFPDRFRLHLSLRRPIVAVLTGDDEPLCLVDEFGVMLPWVDGRLPKLRLYREGGNATMAVALGQVSHEPRVRVAAGIAKEWRDELVPLVAGCPTLLEIDAINLGERYVCDPEYPEIRVLLQRTDGQAVIFGYGRPVGSLDRVPVRTKAEVLRMVLAQHEGLEELVTGDLRFVRRWADYLQPRAAGVPDPNGPWKELLPLKGR